MRNLLLILILFVLFLLCLIFLLPLPRRLTLENWKYFFSTGACNYELCVSFIAECFQPAIIESNTTLEWVTVVSGVRCEKPLQECHCYWSSAVSLVCGICSSEWSPDTIVSLGAISTTSALKCTAEASLSRRQSWVTAQMSAVDFEPRGLYYETVTMRWTCAKIRSFCGIEIQQSLHNPTAFRVMS